MSELHTTAGRSRLMKGVRQEGTSAELRLRKVMHSLGARYRLNITGLPGRPDLANRSRRKAIFVHGCFWHYHETCQRGTIPKRNPVFWKRKLADNRERDARKETELRKMGFDVLVVWECELTDVETLRARLTQFWYG
jgi:DNA mismatch endonuclease, patch repair protein